MADPVIIKACVAYDGHNYHGWQKQINALGIQDIIETALAKIHKYPTAIIGSGRTDAKVHALKQVIQFDGRPDISLYQYERALNALLPEDIRIYGLEYAPGDFHARFSVKQKHYDYVCTLNRHDPFASNYKAVLLQQPDLALMRQGAAYLVGEHDFTSFSSAKIHPDKPRTKKLESIEITQEGPDIRFSFKGNGFLRYQVRMMTAALLEAGYGHIPPAAIQTMLAACSKDACRWNAPAQGLYLMDVCYEEV